MKMKVREFITLNMDIDVYDDVCEELAIAFCGSMMLTEKGEKHFKEALDYDIELDTSGEIWTAAVCVDGDDGNGWKRRLKKATELFYALAGYCSDEDYREWFKEPEWGQYATNPDANISVCVYCDETPWFTEEEMYKDNLCDMQFPRELVQQFYISNGGDIMTFVQWYTEEYTADDTIGLFNFCKERGFTAVREDV